MASKKRRIKPLFVLLVGILCFALGIGGGYVLFHKETEKSSLNNRTLLQLYNAMNNQFYDTTNENTSLLERLSKGLVLGAGDPHTSYMTKSEFDSFQDSVDGDYEALLLRRQRVRLFALFDLDGASVADPCVQIAFRGQFFVDTVAHEVHLSVVTGVQMILSVAAFIL